MKCRYIFADYFILYSILLSVFFVRLFVRVVVVGGLEQSSIQVLRVGAVGNTNDVLLEPLKGFKDIQGLSLEKDLMKAHGRTHRWGQCQ